MPWRIDIQPNGKYAGFSTIVDHFIEYGMTREQAISVCIEKGMDAKSAEEKVRRGESRGVAQFLEDIDTLRLVHGDEEADKVTTDMSSPTEIL